MSLAWSLAWWLLFVSWANCESGDSSNEYYCLEDYKPIGQLLSEQGIRQSDRQRTSGHIARQCSIACTAEPLCTAFKAIGATAAGGPGCQLLANTSAASAGALSIPKGADWPTVLTNTASPGSIQLRPDGWLCLRGAELWDTLGQATHAAIHTGSAAPPYPNVGHKYYCAFGTDTAGTNLQQYTTNIQHPSDCDALCANSTGGSCEFWTFVAAQPGSGQAPYNCFIRTDPFAGENGYTGKPKPDVWIPDSEMECFTQLADWRQLGIILSPAVKVVPYNGSYYTLYPERVTWREAAQACSSMPGSKLAIVDAQGAIDIVYRELLSTLSPETGITSAWVGATGVNTHYNASAPNQTGLTSQRTAVSLEQLSQLPLQRVQNHTGPGPEVTLRWLSGKPVDTRQLRRVILRTEYWSAHDVIWNQQYIPDSSRNVCVRVLVQTPTPQQAVSIDASSAVLPGLWYFECSKPAPYICQSRDPPAVAMIGRTRPSDSNIMAVPAPDTLAPNWKIAVAVIVPVFALLLFLWQLSCFYSPHSSRIPEIIRQQHKRALGRPRHGPMSIVVTDIQGYTNLMREQPDQMTQALMLHNQVIKHACYANIGYILEQEGDSFTLVFHDAQDAVAFTKQVQESLLDQQWPPMIVYNDGWDFQVATTDAADPQQHTDEPAGMSIPASAGHFHSPTSYSPVHSPAANDNTNKFPARTAHSPSAMSLGGHSLITAFTTVEPDYGQPPMSAPSRGPTSWLQHALLTGEHTLGEVPLFHGPRVRMGVATGVVLKGEDVKCSGLYKLAQDISNIGLGGQVLLDEATFLAIRNDREASRHMTSTDLKQKANPAHCCSNPTGWKRDKTAGGLLGDFVSCSCRTPGSRQLHVEHSDLILDMGCYEIKTETLDTAAAAAAGTRRSTLRLWTRDTGEHLVKQYQDYLQYQLQHSRENEQIWDTHADAFISAGSDPGDTEQGYGQLSVTGRIQAGAAAQQHLQSWLSMQQQQLEAGQLQGAQFAQQRGGTVVGQANQPDAPSGLEWVRQSMRLGLEHKSVNGVQQHQEPGSRSMDLAVSEPLTWSLSQVTQGVPTVRLYQILPPALAGRAAVFGAQLSLPTSWIALDAPCYAAPGLSTATVADAGSSTKEHQGYVQDRKARRHSLEYQRRSQVNPVQSSNTVSITMPAAADAALLRDNAVQAAVSKSTVSPFAAAAASSCEPAAASTSTRQKQQQQQPTHVYGCGPSPSSDGHREPSGLLRALSSRAERALSSLTQAHAQTGSAVTQQAAAGATYPIVVLVSITVEGREQLLRRPLLARATHMLLHQLMLKTLRAHPSSYLSKAHEQDLTYTAAFPTAAAAAEWCVTVQEACLYLPYPLQVLQLSGFGIQVDVGGRLVFRGPRLKMGICQGVPTYVGPDSIGRAQYHGSVVDQAFKYAENTALGGQTITDAQTATKVLQDWQCKTAGRPNSLEVGNGDVPCNTHRPKAVEKGSTGEKMDSRSSEAHVQGNDIVTSAKDQRAVRDHTSNRTMGLFGGNGMDHGANAFTAPPTTTSIPAGGLLTPVAVNCSWVGQCAIRGSQAFDEMVCISPVVLAGRSYPAGAAVLHPGAGCSERVEQVTVLLPSSVEGFRV